jgi:trans-aconitate methyltransferase
MRQSRAVDLLAPGLTNERGPATWADLGCGRGTFTLALAHLLAPDSTIHAMDQDRAALASLPAHHKGVSIHTWRGDFLDQPWPFTDLDGLLMANSLHYVRDQAAFIDRSVPYLKPGHRFLIVEYDTDEANRWVPYPVGRAALRSLFAAAGYSSITVLGSRRSIYHRFPLYSALVQR